MACQDEGMEGERWKEGFQCSQDKRFWHRWFLRGMIHTRVRGMDSDRSMDRVIAYVVCGQSGVVCVQNEIVCVQDKVMCARWGCMRAKSSGVHGKCVCMDMVVHKGMCTRECAYAKNMLCRRRKREITGVCEKVGYSLEMRCMRTNYHRWCDDQDHN